MNPLRVYEVTIPSAHITIKINAIVHNTVQLLPHCLIDRAAVRRLITHRTVRSNRRESQLRSRRPLALHGAPQLDERRSLNLPNALLADAHV